MRFDWKNEDDEGRWDENTVKNRAKERQKERERERRFFCVCYGKGEVTREGVKKNKGKFLGRKIENT